MISTAELHTLIQLHREGCSIRAIAARMSISKNTAQKYIKQYKELYMRAMSKDPDDTLPLQEFLNAPVRRKETRPRNRSKLTPEVIALIRQILENEKPADQESNSPNRKTLTKTQIHKLIVQAGFDISLSTVSNAVNEIRAKK